MGAGDTSGGLLLYCAFTRATDPTVSNAEIRIFFFIQIVFKRVRFQTYQKKMICRVPLAKYHANKKRGCLKSCSVIADLFRDLDFVVLSEIPAQGRNDIPILI